MATFNDYVVSTRTGRPSVEGRTLLNHLHFYSGGYRDPYKVESVHILSDIDGTVDRYLDYSTSSEDYLCLSQESKDNALAVFTPDSFDDYYNEIEYNPSSISWEVSEEASGIYYDIDKPGHYNIILDGGINSNSASSVGSYFDVWTIIDMQGSKRSIFTHKFSLSNDTVIGLTEPLAITASSKLLTKYFKHGSDRYIKIKVDFVINNNSIPNDVKNIFGSFPIEDPKIQIKRVLDNTYSDPFETLIPWTSIEEVLSDNILMYKFDSTPSRPGTYRVEISFSILDEFYKDDFTLVIR